VAGEGGRLALRPVLERLAALEMNEVFVEAGPTLAGAFVREGLADELLVYVAPCLLGPDARALLDLPLITALADAPRFEFVDVSPVGTDLRLRLKPLRRT
jgi:diaminohydroxyphosphoribosylaminopyrimidine deaminase/5-amino-6-(5-phosphoribosylamino)uracil reductase